MMFKDESLKKRVWIEMTKGLGLTVGRGHLK